MLKLFSGFAEMKKGFVMKFIDVNNDEKIFVCMYTNRKLLLCFKLKETSPTVRLLFWLNDHLLNL